MNARPSSPIALIAAVAAFAWFSAACGSTPVERDPVPYQSPTPSSRPASPAVSPTPPVVSTTPIPTSSPDTPVTSSDTPAAPTPTIAVAADRERVLAPIDDAQLIIRESYPPQYAVHIVSGLPSGCALFAGTSVARSGTDITITVENSMPRDQQIACTQVYGTHEETIALGSDVTPGATYSVHVNDRILTFTAQ